MKKKKHRILKNYIGLIWIIWPVGCVSIVAIAICCNNIFKCSENVLSIAIIVWVVLLFLNVLHFFLFSKMTIIFLNQEKIWTKTKGRYCEWKWDDLTKVCLDKGRVLPKWFTPRGTTERDKLCWILSLGGENCENACCIPIYRGETYEKIKSMCSNGKLIKQMDEVLKDIWEE